MALLLPPTCEIGPQAQVTSLEHELELLRNVGQELADDERQLETGLPILRDPRGVPLKKDVLEGIVRDARAVERSAAATEALRHTVRRVYLERQRSYLESDRDRAKARDDAYAERRAGRESGSAQSASGSLKRSSALSLVKSRTSPVTPPPCPNLVGVCKPI